MAQDIFSGLPPELAAENRRLQQQQKMSEIMMQRAMAPIESQTAGGYVVPISPFAGMAKLLNAYAGRKAADKSDEDFKGLSQRYNEGLAQAVRDYSASGSRQVQAPDFGAMTGGMDEQDVPMRQETVQADPRERLIAAMTSPYAPVRDIAMADYKTSSVTQGPIKLREGEVAFDPVTRQPIMTNERPKTPQELKAPPIRKVIQGGIEVQQELQPDGTWKELGRGPRFKTTPDVVSNTTVRVDKSDDEYLKQVRGGQAKAYLELEKSAESAAKQISALDRFIEASEKGTAGGAQPLITGVQNFLSSFGYSPESLKNTVVMQQVIGDILGTKMAELGARGLTDKDMQILREALPRVETDRNARVTVANIMRRNAENTLNEYDNARSEQARIYPEFSAKNPVQGWYRDYRKRNNRRSGDVPAEPPPGAVRRIP